MSCAGIKGVGIKHNQFATGSDVLQHPRVTLTDVTVKAPVTVNQGASHTLRNGD